MLQEFQFPTPFRIKYSENFDNYSGEFNNTLMLRRVSRQSTFFSQSANHFLGGLSIFFAILGVPIIMQPACVVSEQPQNAQLSGHGVSTNVFHLKMTAR
jgi:hypothetical protein